MAGSDGSAHKGQVGVGQAECSAAPPLEEEGQEEEPPPASPPSAFLCPISLTLMADPVLVVPTGQTYERGSIEAWLASHSTCPATGQRLQRPVPLVPVFALRSAIEEWARRHAPQLLNQEGHVQPQGDCPGPLVGSSLPRSGDMSSTAGTPGTAGAAIATSCPSQHFGGRQAESSGGRIAGQQAQQAPVAAAAPATAAGFYYPTAEGALLVPNSGGSAREVSGRGAARSAMPRLSAAPLLAQSSSSLSSSGRGRRPGSSNRSRSIVSFRGERSVARAEHNVLATPASRQSGESVSESGRAARGPRISAAPLLLPLPHRSAAGQAGSSTSAGAQRGQQRGQQQSRSSGGGGSSSRGSYVLPPAQLYRPRSGRTSRERAALAAQQQQQQLRASAASCVADSSLASPCGHISTPEGVRTPVRLTEGGQRQERPAMLYPAPLLLPRQPKPPHGASSGGGQGAGARRAATEPRCHRTLPVIVGAPLVPGHVAKKRGCAIQ